MHIDDRPTSDLGQFLMALDATGHLIHFMFGSRVGFRGWRIETRKRYFQICQILPISWKISAIACTLLSVWFYGRFFVVGWL